MAKVITNQKNSAQSAGRALTASQRKEVEKLSYEFFLERGGKHGHDREDWLRAESIVRSRRN